MDFHFAIPSPLIVPRAHTILVAISAASLLGGCDASKAPTPDDAGRDAGGDDCAVERARIGSAGGTLTLCDATLVVAPGQLTEPIDFAIERVDDPPAVPAPFAIVGHAWRFSATSAAEAGVLGIELAHDSDRPLEIARLEGGAWEVHGACEQTESSIGTSAWWELGTFAAITDARDLPADPTGIGAATVDTVLGDRSMRSSTGTEGFLTDELALTGLRTFALHATDSSHALSMEVALFPDGSLEPVFVLLADGATGEEWTADTFAHPEALQGHAEYEGGALRAVVEGVLHGPAEQQRVVSIAVEGTPGPWWREPPRICVD